MTKNELMELVVWIAVRVMGWKLREDIGEMQFGECRLSGGEIIFKEKGHGRYRFNPVVNDADALKVLERCAGKCGVEIFDSTVSQVKCYTVRSNQLGGPSAQAETLPLAIAKFAKLLYSEKG